MMSKRPMRKPNDIGAGKAMGSSLPTVSRNCAGEALYDLSCILVNKYMAFWILAADNATSGRRRGGSGTSNDKTVRVMFRWSFLIAW